MDNIPRPISIVPLEKGNLRTLAKRMLDEKWTKATAIDEETNELTLETDQSEEVYLELPRILRNEKISVQRIYSEDDSLKMRIIFQLIKTISIYLMKK